MRPSPNGAQTGAAGDVSATESIADNPPRSYAVSARQRPGRESALLRLSLETGTATARNLGPSLGGSAGQDAVCRAAGLARRSGLHRSRYHPGSHPARRHHSLNQGLPTDCNRGELTCEGGIAATDRSNHRAIGQTAQGPRLAMPPRQVAAPVTAQQAAPDAPAARGLSLESPLHPADTVQMQTLGSPTGSVLRKLEKW